MSGENWTPGPWVVGTAPPNGEQTIGARGMMVALATRGEMLPPEETLANARLIAAAPELYEALKTACVNALELGHCVGYDCPNCSAGRALKKARGES